MKVSQIILLVFIILYMIFSCVNIMDTYSEEAKENFRSERNWKLGISIFILILLYLC